MAGRIVLFGATGYTGDLTARALVAQGAQPVLAARSADRLAALAAELGGLETAVADVVAARQRARPRRARRRAGVDGGPVRALRRAGGGGRRGHRRALPGLHRRGTLHPRGLRALRPGRPGCGERPRDRVRLRLGAGQPGGRPRPGRGGRARRARGDRLLHARRGRRGVHERRHARQRGRTAARAELRLARRAAGHRARRGPRQGLRAASRQAGAGHLGRHVASTWRCRA